MILTNVKDKIAENATSQTVPVVKKIIVQLKYQDELVIQQLAASLPEFEDLINKEGIMVDFVKKSHTHVVDLSTILLKKQGIGGNNEVIVFEDFKDNFIKSNKLDSKLNSLVAENSEEKLKAFLNAKTECIECINKVFEKTNSFIIQALSKTFNKTAEAGGFTPTLHENIGAQIHH
jgi:hypothetical protein